MSKSVKPIGLARSRNVQNDWQNAVILLTWYRHFLKKENGGLNQVLRPAKPPTYMTTSIVLYQRAKKAIVNSGVIQ